MLNSDRANFLRRAAARNAGDGAAAQQLAARFDVGSGKQHTAGSGHARHAEAGRGRAPQAAAGGRSARQVARGTARAAMAAGREKLEEISIKGCIYLQESQILEDGEEKSCEKWIKLAHSGRTSPRRGRAAQEAATTRPRAARCSHPVAGNQAAAVLVAQEEQHQADQAQQLAFFLLKLFNSCSHY